MEKAQPFGPLQKPLIVLVIGECGDGKSSLIRHFYESTPKGTQLKIMHHFNANLELPDPPGVGASTSGVTKRATAYPVLIGTRSVVLIDSPGVGDSDIKPEQILAGLMKELESDVLNAVLLCTAMPKKRLTMGQKFCTDLIDRLLMKNASGRISSWWAHRKIFTTLARQRRNSLQNGNAGAPICLPL
jgi:predicted GTPase